MEGLQRQLPVRVIRDNPDKLPLFFDNLFYKTHKDFYSPDHRYNAERVDQQQEIDRILDKISRKGMRSLNRKEKKALEEYSKKIR